MAELELDNTEYSVAEPLQESRFDEIRSMVFDGWLFKAMIALIDTPIFYLLVFLGKRFFNLGPGEELDP